MKLIQIPFGKRAQLGVSRAWNVAQFRRGVSRDGSTPADMIEAFFHISEVSNEQGMEALLLVASKNGLQLPEGDPQWQF